MINKSLLNRSLLFIILLLCLTFNYGCAGTAATAPSGSQVAAKSSIEQAQDAATKTVIAMGDVLITAPGMLKAFRQSGQITKEGYNAGVDIYNQALASYTLLNQALQAAITAGKDPGSVVGYTTALATFTTDRNLLSNIIKASGG